MKGIASKTTRLTVARLGRFFHLEMWRSSNKGGAWPGGTAFALSTSLAADWHVKLTCLRL